MKNIQLLNKIAAVGTDIFDRTKYNLSDSVENPDAIMVRSAVMHDMTFGDKLRAVARAGAGVNNIPVDKLADAGIVVFNTPGANANGVKELTLAALLLASRDITGGVDWVRTLKDTPDAAKVVEKEKSRFAGVELAGKTLGVIGLGAIGGMVANTARHLGMKVIGYDPYLTVEAAWSLSRDIEKAAGYDDIFARCDYITMHIPATDETRGMFNADAFAKMKDGVRLVNLSRADLVNAADLNAAIEAGKVARYVTDFPTPEIIDRPGIVAIPHLGASTNESEDNCAVMAAHELIDFLETGNIKNSVNYPNCAMPHSGDVRICLMHKNIPNVLSQISSAIAAENLNIENMLNRSKKEYAYTIVEVKGAVSDSIIAKFNAIEGLIRVTVY